MTHEIQNRIQTFPPEVKNRISDWSFLKMLGGASRTRYRYDEMGSLVTVLSYVSEDDGQEQLIGQLDYLYRYDSYGNPTGLFKIVATVEGNGKVTLYIDFSKFVIYEYYWDLHVPLRMFSHLAQVFQLVLCVKF